MVAGDPAGLGAVGAGHALLADGVVVELFQMFRPERAWPATGDLEPQAREAPGEETHGEPSGSGGVKRPRPSSGEGKAASTSVLDGVVSCCSNDSSGWVGGSQP